MALIAGVAAAVLAIGGGVAYFVLSPSDPDEPVGQQTSVSAQSGASEGATTEQDEGDNDRLMKVLPRGYPDGACKPVARLDGALATIACTVNKDPGGPMSATYSLLVDSAALKAAIDNLETTSTVVDCPGRIQSPGPWRHNASLHEVSGTLMCGIQNDNPMLAWTNFDDQMFAVVQGRPAGPTLDNLYAWWSTHS
ncbi:hypothetical protein AVZ31_07225 [Mycolicibacterium neoaurum]|uniref:Serine/threonine protein kinase n=1 Tax=Mycolicibacterium neoaurum VKM Ac-1815D TaxID=700508 RepID=V5XF61_MYCNE|nr:hypothetical protein DXK33_03340 [Mycolicibacterium neoaurum]KUM09417.1 hypothetical protein AVZ31_07225 [Mycolicibacterium neoaurum]